MTHLGYIVAGWSISLGAIGGYAAYLLHRGRTLSARVGPDRRRWMNADD